ncbi:SnoaL-like domain-containing protein [Cladophialophora immunda]|nr:SnoaL-like domain-containing protein [Cladophialophora immunda]
MADQSDVIEQLQKRLKLLEDKESLATLLNTYCTTADRHDWNAYADVYIGEGAVMSFESWGDINGKEAIAKAASAEQIFEGLQHTMTNMQFEVDGDDATGTAYLWFCATPETAKPEINYAFGGPYSFNFKRTSEGWRISHMRLKKIWALGKDTKGVFGAN